MVAASTNAVDGMAREPTSLVGVVRVFGGAVAAGG
jgi:hypothetical protein